MPNTFQYITDKIPTPTRDEMMSMTVSALSHVTKNLDSNAAFKSLFVTNAFNGSEDYLVSDKIMKLIGEEMIEFREKLMEKEPPSTLNELLKTITPPKGIKRKNCEGSELMDCDGDEIEENVENEELENDEDDEGKVKSFAYALVVQCICFMTKPIIFSYFSETKKSDENEEKIIEKTKSKSLISLTGFCDDPDVNSDAQFMDDLHGIIEKHQTSKLFTPYMSQLKSIHQRARRSLKKRIDQKVKVKVKHIH